MDLFKANIFKTGFLKQVKFLISVPLQSEKILHHSETGVMSLEMLPVSVGFVVSHKARMAWNCIQKLKIQVEGVEGLVLPVSSRSRYPLDPFNKLSEEEKKSQGSLDTIFSQAYCRAFARLSDKDIQSPNAKMVTTIIWLLSALIGLAIIGVLIKSKTG